LAVASSVGDSVILACPQSCVVGCCLAGSGQDAVAPYFRTCRLRASFEPHHGKEPTG